MRWLESNFKSAGDTLFAPRPPTTWDVPNFDCRVAPLHCSLRPFPGEKCQERWNIVVCGRANWTLFQTLTSTFVSVWYFDGKTWNTGQRTGHFIAFWWNDQNWWFLLLGCHYHPLWCQEFLSARVSQKYILACCDWTTRCSLTHELHGEKNHVHIFLESYYRAHLPIRFSFAHFSYNFSDWAWFEVPKVENDATQPEAGFWLGAQVKIWFDPFSGQNPGDF